MEVLLRDLGSSETPIRLIAIEKVAQKLENKNWLRDVAVSMYTTLVSKIQVKIISIIYCI